MRDSTPPPKPNTKRVFLLLCKAGLNKEETYTFVQELENMAAANLIARFESKLDSQGARYKAGLVDLWDQFRRERAMIWTLIGILGTADGWREGGNPVFEIDGKRVPVHRPGALARLAPPSKLADTEGARAWLADAVRITARWCDGLRRAAARGRLPGSVG